VRIFKRSVNGIVVEHLIDGVTQPISDLGTKVERVAQPIARAIDTIAGTKISKCAGCNQMKERLNTGMSFAEAFKLRLVGK